MCPGPIIIAFKLLFHSISLSRTLAGAGNLSFPRSLLFCDNDARLSSMSLTTSLHYICVILRLLPVIRRVAAYTRREQTRIE